MTNAAQIATADWPEPDTSAPRVSGLTLLLTSVGAVLIGVLSTTQILGVINERNVEHASQGLPALLGAFGAVAVALGVAVRLWEDAWTIKVEIAQQRLSAIKGVRFPRDTAPDEDQAKFDRRIAQQEAMESDKASDIVKAATAAARFRSFSAGLEFGGAGLLAAGAVCAAIIWNWS